MQFLRLIFSGECQILDTSSFFSAEPALSSSSALDMANMAIDYGGRNEIGTEKQLDMLEIPGKGRCFVFLARQVGGHT